MKTNASHPLVQKIVSEIQLEDGAAMLPASRFDFWASVLPAEHPRTKEPQLYGQLVAASLIFAQRRAPAGAQLYALGTL